MKAITRREFIITGSVLAGTATSFLALGNGALSAKKAHAARIDFSESSCGPKDKENKKILVAYASKYGSTSGVADVIGKELCNKGADVDVCLLKNVKNLSEYRSVILGSAIYRGKWLTEAVDFVEGNRGVLQHVPVAYFMVCMTMREPTEENRQNVLAYLNPVLKAVPQVRPVKVGAFAGALNYGNLSMPIKMAMKLKGAPEGDFRDWNVIRLWTENLVSSVLSHN